MQRRPGALYRGVRLAHALDCAEEHPGQFVTDHKKEQSSLDRVRIAGSA